MSKNTTITVRGAVALGVGSMVGAGIFALMGEAARMAGSAVWAAFLGAGIVALLTGYSFVQLGVRYPSRGGVVEYLVKAYGSGWFSGGSSILFYMAQLIGMSMIALAFGAYASKLIGIDGGSMLWDRLLASGLILTLTALNLFGSKLVSKIQGLVVVNFLTLTTVASLGSATSLMVYSLVNFGAFRLIKNGGMSRFPILLSVIACVVAIGVWFMYTLRTSPGSLWIFFLFLVSAFVAEGLLQRFRGRKIQAEKDWDVSASGG